MIMPHRTAADRARRFLRVLPIGRPHVGDGSFADVSGLASLTVADLRVLIHQADALRNIDPYIHTIIEVEHRKLDTTEFTD